MEISKFYSNFKFDSKSFGKQALALILMIICSSLQHTSYQLKLQQLL